VKNIIVSSALSAMVMFAVGCSRPIKIPAAAVAPLPPITSTGTATDTETSSRIATETSTSTATVTDTSTKVALTGELSVEFSAALSSSSLFRVKPGQKDVNFGTLFFVNKTNKKLEVREAVISSMISREPWSGTPWADANASADGPGVIASHIENCRLRSWPSAQVFVGPTKPDITGAFDALDMFEVERFTGQNALALSIICDISGKEAASESGIGFDIMHDDCVSAYDSEGNRAKVSRMQMNGNPPKVAAVLQPQGGCEVVGTADLSADSAQSGKKVQPLALAASDEGSAVAFYDAETKGITVYLYDTQGRFLSVAGMAAEGNAYPSAVKMAGGKNDYMIAIADVPASESNGWLADYAIYHVGVGIAEAVAQPKGVRALALASGDSLIGSAGGDFYSIETVDGGGVSSVQCEDGGWNTQDTLSVRIRPLLSGLMPSLTLGIGHGMAAVDAVTVGDKMRILVTGAHYDCRTSYSMATVMTQKMFAQDGNLLIDGNPGTAETPLSVISSGAGTCIGRSLFSSETLMGILWEDSAPDSVSKHRISSWRKGATDLETILAQTAVSQAALGWDDKIVQAVESNGPDSVVVSLYVGTGMDGFADRLYDNTNGRYVKSFAGKDRHFVILDGVDTAHGTYGAWATFVTCE
jgi:hypothetical protein